MQEEANDHKENKIKIDELENKVTLVQSQLTLANLVSYVI